MGLGVISSRRTMTLSLLSVLPSCQGCKRSQPPGRGTTIQNPRRAWCSAKEAKRRAWSWIRGDAPGPTQNGSEHAKADFSQEENTPVSKVPVAPRSRDKNAAPTRAARRPGAVRVSLESRALRTVRPRIPHTKASLKQQSLDSRGFPHPSRTHSRLWSRRLPGRDNQPPPSL